MLSLRIVAALLIAGLAAAPLAAWLVRIVTPRLLGALVGGLIVVTNVRTLFTVADEPAAVRGWTYVALLTVWAGAVAFVVRAHRRDGTPRSSGGPAR